jgi:uncharacterized membrane protein
MDIKGGKMLAQFMLFGALGLITEVVFTSLKRLFAERVFELKGETSLWMFPIYGLIAFFFPLIIYRISSFPWFIRGAVYMVVFYIVEYLSGWVLRKLKVCPWEYPQKYSLHGLIYFPYAPFWFAAGLGIEKIYPKIILLSRAF